MEQKETCKLTIWENLYKEFGKSILRTDALVSFVEHCMESEDETVTLNNPVNSLGNIEMGKEETLPFVISALNEEKKRAAELVRRIKDLLDAADYETWNRSVISPKCRAAIEKWKEVVPSDGITATFDRNPDGLMDKFRREMEEMRGQ